MRTGRENAAGRKRLTAGFEHSPCSEIRKLSCGLRFLKEVAIVLNPAEHTT
jgi:hypothetical protein